MSNRPLPPTGDDESAASTAQSFRSELADLVTSLTATSILTTAMARGVVEAARLYGLDETAIMLCEERGKRRAVLDLVHQGMGRWVDETLPNGDLGSFEAIRDRIAAELVKE